MQSRKNVVLGLDTSGSPLLVTAAKQTRTAVRRRSGIKQERLLFPVLESALSAVGGTLQEVKKIIIVRGPGRFTGIRIALTFASMLKYLNQAEVYGATVFEILKYQVENSRDFKQWKANHPKGVLGVVLHAFRQEYFLQIFDEKKALPKWLSYQELQTCLATYKAPLFLAGTAADKAPLQTILKGPYTWACMRDCVVRPDTLQTLCGNAAFATDALEPLYLKPARFELVQPK